MPDEAQARAIGLSEEGDRTRRAATMELRPIPDPTVLTTQQLFREVATSREIVETKIEAAVRSIDTRISAMDKALVLVQGNADKFPGQVVAAIRQLQELHEEKFKSVTVQLMQFAERISLQFAERDARTEQTSKDSKVAVDAALQAAKEAVNAQQIANALANSKMEAAFTKQIDQIMSLIATMQKGLDDKIIDSRKGQDDKIEDVKKNMQSMDLRIQSKAGVDEGHKKGMSESTAMLFVIIAMIVSVVSIIAGFFHHA